MKPKLSGDELLEVLEALSNPYRLKIISILHQEKHYVSHLARVLEISRPLLYLHLKKLETAGLIKGYHEISDSGKTMKFYQVNSFNISLNELLITEAAKSLTNKKKEQER